MPPDANAIPQLGLLLTSSLRAVVEVAGYALLGQGLVALVAGKHRAGNPVYRLFQIVASPATRVTRILVPRIVPDGYIPAVAFFLLFCTWVVLALIKHRICATHGLSC